MASSSRLVFAGQRARDDRECGLRRDGDRMFDIIVATPRGGAPVTVWIDHASHLLDRTVAQLNETRRIEHFSDWRTVDGTVIAFERDIEYPEDESVERLTVTRADSTSALSASAFSAPRTSKDVRFNGNSTETQVRYTLEGRPIIEVRVNGQGPLPFAVDTGGHFIITAATAHRLGLAVQGSANNLGQGEGILKAGFAHVRSVRIGSAVMTDQVAKILPYRFRKVERGPRQPIAGWLGLEFFERFAITFNPKTHLLTLRQLHRPRPEPPGTRVALYFDEDAPLIKCAVYAIPGILHGGHWKHDGNYR